MRTDDILTGKQIPVYTLSGFLGSGKTSLLVRLLEHPRMARTAVIVNEFSDVGIDQLTIRQVDDEVRLLARGCVCCVTRDDLLATLRALYVDRLRDGVDGCDRVVIETSGMADPIPVVHTLLADPMLQERFIYRGTLVTIDALQPASRLLTRKEAVRQVAAADLFVLTKADLADSGAAADLQTTLRRMNPVAVVLGNDPASLEDIVGRIADERVDRSPQGLPPATWLADVLGRARSGSQAPSFGPLTRGRIGHQISPVESYVLRLSEPVQWPTFVAWLQRLLAHNTERLLRLKGVVDVEGEPEPIIVQAVRQLFHPCAPMPRRPGDEVGSRLVLIVDNPRRLSWRTLGMDTLGVTLFEACARNEPSRMGSLEMAFR